jgi:hypothetical protein
VLLPYQQIHSPREIAPTLLAHLLPAGAVPNEITRVTQWEGGGIAPCHRMNVIYTKETMRNKSRFHLLRWHHIPYSFPEVLQIMLMPNHRLPMHVPTTLAQRADCLIAAKIYLPMSSPQTTCPWPLLLGFLNDDWDVWDEGADFNRSWESTMASHKVTSYGQ